MLKLVLVKLVKLVLVALVVDGVGLHWQEAQVDPWRRGVISQRQRQLPVQLLLMVAWPNARTFIVFRCKSICCRISQAFSSPDRIEENTSTDNPTLILVKGLDTG